MPTATMTTQDTTSHSPTSIPLKSTSPTSMNPAATTLRSLYPRAAKAFLHRDVTLTYSLLTSAFAIIQPPASFTEDALVTHRRKWEILRITFETTLYTSPPASEDPEALPAPLRANQMLSPQSLVTLLHTRSLQLFTPSSLQKPSAAFLPSQILVTLVLASLKARCPEVGRQIIEDWLAKRSPTSSSQDSEGYSKILELYSLQVLPALEEWDYASEFLQYELELPPDVRQYLITSLQTLRTQALTRSQQPATTEPSISPPSAESSRTASPAPSISSESSSSTHTATPLSPRPSAKSGKGKPNGRMPLVARMTPSSSASSSSQSISSIATSKTVTPRSVQRSNGVPRGSQPNGRANGHVRSESSSPKASITPLPRPPRSLPLQPSTSSPHQPSTFTIIRSYFDKTLLTANKTKALTYILLFVIFPLISFVIRLRRRRHSTVSTAGAAADEVRRRLRGNAQGKSVLARIWDEAVRAVTDTVRMGGRGLV